jgi:TonB-linked SusC/RagA family outer membrane protein
VLKDGSAAAVYGSRASNGVILITTKRFAGGAPTLRYDGYVSQSALYKSPDFLNAADYRRLIGEGVGFTDLGFDTDWQSQVIREPVNHRHNLTLSGGATNTNYTASVNYENTEGIFRRSDNQEVTARANIRHLMFDGRLEAEANLLSRTEKNFFGSNFDATWRQTLIRNPTDRVRDDAGNWQERGTYMYWNPAALIDEQNGEEEERTTRLHGTLTLRPIESLRLSVMGGTSRRNYLNGTATTFKHQSNTQGNSGGTASRRTESGVDRIVELTGTLTEQVANHNFTLLGGYGYQDFVDENFQANNSRFPTDLFGWDQLQRGSGLGEGIAGISSDKTGYKLIGFFGRLNYDWQNKYLLMASVRYEGNSRFGEDHKWGVFPAISAGWRISEESFLDGLSFIDDLRLRVGYGVTGIAPNNSYLSLTSYSYGQRFLYNGQWVQGLGPARNPNPNLRWEEKEEINVGLNFAMFNSRLSGSFDVYKRDTNDMLYNYSVPVPPNVTSTILANVGTMTNNGVEAELSYDIFSRPGLRWTTSANWSTNSNKLVSLSDDTYKPTNDCFQPGDGHTGEPIQQFTHQVCVGGPIGNFYGYKSVDIDDDGVWIVQDSAGQNISIVDATAGDRQVLGNGLPKHYFAWNNMAQVRNFDLSVNMRGAAGFQILNYLRMYYENPTVTDYNKLKSAFEPVYGKRQLNYNLAYVSYYVEDGDYVKLDNVTLGYTFGAGSLGRFSNVLSNARLYVSGRNLWTITGYKGLDPEVQINPLLAPGNDSRDNYPTTRVFTAGVTLTF